jgi:DNA repair exonuclease SbcCD nuclease subunit
VNDSSESGDVKTDGGESGLDLDDVFNGFFVIGDIHFRSKHVLEAEEFMEKCLKQIEETFPSAIILLGDVLDTHEVVRNVPYKMACTFIEKCSALAPTFVLVGNHDYINNSQYMTDNHFFVPMKKWKNVYIIDRPTKHTYQDVTFLMCPYVPNGRFVESIVSVYGRRWYEGVNVVFAHQEIKGVCLRHASSDGALLEPSTKGDSYGAGYPPLISGHIHHPQTIKPNVYYPGSAMQIASDEDPDKSVWLVNIVDDCENKLDIEKFNLGLKGIKDVRMHVDKVESEFDWSMTERYYIRLRLSGTHEHFRMFRKGKVYSSLISRGVRVAFEPQQSSTVSSTRHLTSFVDVMNEIVKTKSSDIQSEYDIIKKEIETHNDEIVLDDEDEENSDEDD